MDASQTTEDSHMRLQRLQVLIAEDAAETPIQFDACSRVLSRMVLCPEAVLGSGTFGTVRSSAPNAM